MIESDIPIVEKFINEVVDLSIWRSYGDDWVLNFDETYIHFHWPYGAKPTIIDAMRAVLTKRDSGK